MNSTLYADKLAWFKQNEKPEAVLIIANNQDLIRIVIAWSNLEAHTNDKLIELTKESDDAVWDWLWKNVKFSLTELKAKAGVPYSESVLEQRLKPLIGNRIIYPDGSVNSFVNRYLRGEVAKLFATKPKSKRNL